MAPIITTITTSTSTFLMKFIPSVFQYNQKYNISKGKGKAIPLQAWTGPEGSRRLRLPDFKTIGT